MCHHSLGMCPWVRPSSGLLTDRKSQRAAQPAFTMGVEKSEILSVNHTVCYPRIGNTKSENFCHPLLTHGLLLTRRRSAIAEPNHLEPTLSDLSGEQARRCDCGPGGSFCQWHLRQRFHRRPEQEARAEGGRRDQHLGCRSIRLQVPFIPRDQWLPPTIRPARTAG